MGNPILFIILAVIAIGAAIGMVTNRNAIYSALFLVLTMTVLAVFYLTLNAPFLAMVQITVYAGAIMVLFLFVIMLLGAERLPGLSNWRSPQKISAGILALIMLATLSLSLSSQLTRSTPAPIEAGPREVGMALFQSYVFPFEVTSILLLVAMIGVVVLQVKKRG